MKIVNPHGPYNRARPKEHVRPRVIIQETAAEVLALSC